jgi:plasmid stabilization system protein ParE
MTFRVEISADAERDTEAILEWLLSEQAGETGIRWFVELERVIKSRTSFPERCALAPENQRFPFEVRRCSTFATGAVRYCERGPQMMKSDTA